MMPTDPAILRYLAEAADPGATIRTEEALAASPEARARMAAHRAEIQASAVAAWRIPPPGVPGGRMGFGLTSQAAMVMGEGDELRPGDRFVVHIDPVEDADDRRVVVLVRDEEWKVVFPSDPDEDTRLSDLPVDDEGVRRLDLVARRNTGRQRWAIALPSAELDWDADLRDGIANGEVPVTSVEILVKAA